MALYCVSDKHQFEPRYDEVVEIGTNLQLAIKSFVSETWDSPPFAKQPFPITKIYVHDVCVKCGYIVKR